MSLVKRVDLTTEVAEYDRGNELAGALFNQFNTFHDKDHRPNLEIERILFQQKELEFSLVGVRSPRPDMQIFSPSGASKCARELYLKAMGHKIVDDRLPYHRRWTRNASAVHEVVQKDLLYMGRVMKNPAFTVKMAENGLPMWEENLKTFVEVQHNGAEFAVLGMMDGVLEYRDGSEIGFEFKTKSNSIGQVGNYKMKAPAPYHLEQCTAYSILFGMEEFILMYEAIAKDQWKVKEDKEPKMDIRTFYYKVTEEDKTALLDKFASVTKAIQTKQIPEKQPDKCMFCGYKELCEGMGE